MIVNVVVMIGYVENVHFQISIGVRLVKNVIKHDHLEVLSLDLKIGNVLNVVILIMQEEWNVIDVKDLRGMIDFLFLNLGKRVFYFLS
jgi:hypothetical protein